MLMRDNLAQAVKSGWVKQSAIDDSVRDILIVKYRLGFFTHPYVALEKWRAEIGSPAQHEAARVAAERSAVLLRNQGGSCRWRNPSLDRGRWAVGGFEAGHDGLVESRRDPEIRLPFLRGAKKIGFGETINYPRGSRSIVFSLHLRRSVLESEACSEDAIGTGHRVPARYRTGKKIGCGDSCYWAKRRV